MPRKYSGPLQPGKRSAYVKGTRKRATKKKSVNGKVKTGYKSLNTYSFIRETIPTTKSFSLIDDGIDNKGMGYLNFDNLTFKQLTNATQEFGALFARYKVDKIETILTPLFSAVEAPQTAFSQYSPALSITRVNTKWLNVDFDVSGTADDVLSRLSQLQTKSVSKYSSSRSMKLVTVRPGCTENAIVDEVGAILDTRSKMPWLNIAAQSDVPLKHNSILFAERVDGETLDDKWKYRIVHKIYFRCAQVG